MTTQHNPAEIARLIAEAREDDARMTSAPWRYDHQGWVESMDRGINHSGGETEVLTLGARNATDDGEGAARTRNNLRAMADQLEAQQALLRARAIEINDLAEDRRNLADQLEAAGREVARLKRDVVTVCNNFRQEQREHAEASLSRRDLTAERDKLRADVERLERDNRTTRASLEAANEHLRGLLNGTQASLASAQAELEAARPVVEAAEQWVLCGPTPTLKLAVDAYRAARDKAERCDSCDWTFPCFAEPTKCIKRPLVNTSDGVFDPESSLEVFDRRRR